MSLPVVLPEPPRADPGAGHHDQRVGRHARPFVLLVLLEGRSYGYEIRSRLQAWGFRRSAEDPSVLYRLLRRLEDDGLIASEWDTSGSGPARRYYQLTPNGRAELDAATASLEKQARRIQSFFETYHRLTASEPAS